MSQPPPRINHRVCHVKKSVHASKTTARTDLLTVFRYVAIRSFDQLRTDSEQVRRRKRRFFSRPRSSQSSVHCCRPQRLRGELSLYSRIPSAVREREDSRIGRKLGGE
jgi:hypothetical protein